MRHATALWCVIGITIPAVALAPSVLPAPAAAAPVKVRTSYTDIEHEVMCATCKIPLQVAKSAQSNLERAYIHSLVNRGLTKEQVKRELVNQYGEAVLALPSAHGFNLLVYLIPLAVVLGLIALIATLLPAWRRHARAQAPPTVAERLDSTATARLDADLARFD